MGKGNPKAILAGFAAGVGRVLLNRRSSRDAVLAAGGGDFTSAAITKRIRETHPEALPGERWDLGTGVAAHVWRTPDARAAVLFVPGYHDYAHRYALAPIRTIPRMLGEHLNVYAFDMWGAGYSPGPRGYSDVHDAVNDHLIARKKIEESGLPIFLMGHSMGGLVALASAVKRPGNIAGLVLLAPGVRSPMPTPLRWALRLIGLAFPTAHMPMDNAKVEDVTRDEARQRQMSDDPIVVTGRIPWGVASSVVGASQNVWDGVDKLAMPILIIHGTGDPVAPWEMSQRLIDLIPSADKHLYKIPGMMHSPLDDYERSENRATILKWIADHIPHDPTVTAPSRVPLNRD